MPTVKQPTAATGEFTNSTRRSSLVVFSGRGVWAVESAEGRIASE